MKIGQIFNQFSNNTEFLHKLSELAHDNMLEIAYCDSEKFKKLQKCTGFTGDPSKGRFYPIQNDTVVIVKQGNMVCLFIDIDTISKSKMKREEIEKANKHVKNIKNLTKKVKDVLGEVPVIDNLNKEITELLTVINNDLNYPI